MIEKHVVTMLEWSMQLKKKYIIVYSFLQEEQEYVILKV